MSIRTFVFCDVCNPKGIRMIEERRNTKRSDNPGRRLTDGRAWFEGTSVEATEAGWRTHTDGRHVCPRCQKRGLDVKR